MSFPRYPAYKDSGVEWLGEVPEHWEVKALKREFLVVGGSTPKSDNDLFWDGDIVWVTPADLGRLTSLDIGYSERKITREGLASCATTLVPRGSIILSTRAPIGSLAIATTEVCTNQGCKSLVAIGDVSSSYYGYMLMVCTEELNIRGKGATFLELSGDALASFEAATPPVPEQQVIANFLDRETAKIDALVAEQEKLIELLKEKRQALISRAVTKGLDPTAPMKDSGVEWLGEVPEHWKIVRIKHLLKEQKGAIKTGPFGSHLQNADMTDGEVKVYNQKNVIDRDLSCGEYYISIDKFNELASFEVFHGDLLITTRGTIGRCLIVGNQSERGILHPCLMRLQIDGLTALSSFVEICIQDSGVVMEQLKLKSNATTIDVVYSETLKEVNVALPPVDEQSSIIDFIKCETEQISTLIQEAGRGIDLLKERRSALISAAVTGKIDVRNIEERGAA